MDAAATRTRLERLLAELEDSTEILERGEGDPGEISHLDQHPAEAASELTELEREEVLIAVVRAQHERVLAALGRLDRGTYGRCVECGQDLPEERLDARPEAARCLACQHELEMAR